MKRSKYLDKMINWIVYNGKVKPSDGISDARWSAMVAHIFREYLEEEKSNATSRN